MRAGKIRQYVAVLAGVLAFAAAAGAQGFGSPGAGAGTGPGFAGNRPPMERVFGPMGSGHGWWNNPRVVERLKLTDDQRKAMDSILIEHREKLIDLHANLQKAELAMEPLMGADTPNDAAITGQIDKVVAARAELERANARFLLAIRDKLTADQWKQVRTFGQNMRVHRDEWRHDRDGQRPGLRGPDGRFRGPNPGAQQAPPPPANAPGTGVSPNPGQGSGTGDIQ